MVVVTMVEMVMPRDGDVDLYERLVVQRDGSRSRDGLHAGHGPHGERPPSASSVSAAGILWICGDVWAIPILVLDRAPRHRSRRLALCSPRASLVAAFGRRGLIGSVHRGEIGVPRVELGIVVVGRRRPAALGSRHVLRAASSATCTRRRCRAVATPRRRPRTTRCPSARGRSRTTKAGIQMISAITRPR